MRSKVRLAMRAASVKIGTHFTEMHVHYLCVWVDLLETLGIFVLQSDNEGLETADNLDGSGFVVHSFLLFDYCLERRGCD